MSNNDQQIKDMFGAGAHLGYSKSRRHPSIKPHVFGAKNNIEILNLEDTNKMLEEARDFVKEVASKGKQLLFVGTKGEVREIVKKAAESINQPYMVTRWVGGTLTNFSEIRKRADKLIQLTEAGESGELSKYTKKERGRIAKEVEDLNRLFSGIVDMKKLPGAVFVVDSNAEEISVLEAKKVGIPVLSLSNSDCDISDIDYPIVANDSNQKSVSYFVDQIVKAFEEGRKEISPNVKEEKEEKSS